MKKFFTLVAAAFLSATAFAQVHCEWTAKQLPQTVFATTDEAVAAEYNTLWSSPKWLGMPAQNLIENENIVVSLPCAYSYVSTGNSKYSGKDYAYKIIMGMNNTTRDGIDASYFTDGLTDNDYVRSAGTSDQGNTINDAIIKIEVKSANYGVVTLKYNRGGNNAAMYVVDQSKSKMVLQTVTRCPDDNIQTHTAKFGVEPNHVYYVMASEKGSVELYGISYDECADETYTTEVTNANSDDIWTASQLPQTVFATTDEAVAAEYNTLWSSPKWLGMPSQNLINTDNVVVSLPCAYSYVSTGNSKYSGKDYAYKIIMGMNNTTRDGIDASYFTDGLTDNDYVRSAGTSDQGNTINDAIIKISVPSTGTYGRVILNYNRGGNNAAMYVVDQSKNKMVLQTTTRCPDDNIKTNSAVFNVEPGHDYYVMASEKGSVEFYAIGYCSTTSEKYSALDDTATGISTVSTKVAPADGNIYSVSGVLVGTDKAKLTKGLYIQNGKKFVVK